MFSSLTFAQKELTEYLQIGAENNPALQMRFQQYMASLEMVPQAKALPDPQIAFAWFMDPVETRVGPQKMKISASQFFPWFGILKTKENIAIQNAKAKYEMFLQKKSNLYKEIRSQYYNYFYNQKAIVITEENIELLQSFQKLAEVKLETAQTSAVDLYRIQIELNEWNNQLALLKDQSMQVRIQLNLLLNREEKEEILIPEELWEEQVSLSRESLLNSILTQNHQLVRIELEKEAFVYRKQLAKKEGMPDFNIGVDYTLVGKGENNLSGKDAFLFPKIGISVPLYRKKYKAMLKQTVLEEMAKNSEKQQTENMLKALFENIWKEYRDADRRIELFASQVELANLSLQIMQSEYANDKRDFEEVLNMERKLLKYKLEQEKAKTDKLVAVAFVNYLQGK